MQIEVGKKYRRRDGEIVAISHHDAYHSFGESCPYWGEGRSYRVDGRYMPFGTDDDFDLIEEVVDPSPEPAPLKLEVGKRYRTLSGNDVVMIDQEGHPHREGEFYAFSGFLPCSGRVEGWRGDGRFTSYEGSLLDLVEEVIEAVDEPSDAAEFSFGPAFNPEKSLADILGPGGPIHYAPPSIEPTDLLAALRMLLREVDAGTSGGRIRIDGSAALIDAATLARSVIQRHAP